MLVHQSCSTVPPLTRTRTPPHLVCDARSAVVLALLPRKLPMSCGGLAASDCAPRDFCEQTEVVMWLHIGLTNFCPCQLSFQILKLSAKPLAVTNLIALRVTGRFVSVHPFFASMRMDCTWFGRLCTLWSSEYPLAEVTSLTTPVLFLDSGEAHAES